MQNEGTIHHILGCAVALHWNDFTDGLLPISMQVQYRTGADCSLEYLKVWSSPVRGSRNLICEYRTVSSSEHPKGVSFQGTYASPGLVRLLSAIMRHQESFGLSADVLDGLVQIAPPTENDLIVARHQMIQALDRIHSVRLSSGSISSAMRFAGDHPALLPLGHA